MTSDDLYIAAMAREIRDGDRLFIGNNQPDVALAAHVARRLWAPNLRLWASGQPALDRARDLDAVGLPSHSRELMAHRATFFWQARAFDAMGRHPAVCFAGGLQVDRRGNANLAGIRSGEGWRLRGPGSAGMSSLTAWAPRFYIALAHHDPRTLVEECSAVSVVGDPATRSSLGMAPNALAAVITPLATFVPSPEGLVLTEIRPGLTRQELDEQTGFAVVGEAVRPRPEPTAEEARAIATVRAAATTHRAPSGRKTGRDLGRETGRDSGREAHR